MPLKERKEKTTFGTKVEEARGGSTSSKAYATSKNGKKRIVSSSEEEKEASDEEQNDEMFGNENDVEARGMESDDSEADLRIFLKKTSTDRKQSSKSKRPNNDGGKSHRSQKKNVTAPSSRAGDLKEITIEKKVERFDTGETSSTGNGRPKRNRVAPLEYWRAGEKAKYVDNSLVAVERVVVKEKPRAKVKKAPVEKRHGRQQMRVPSDDFLDESDAAPLAHTSKLESLSKQKKKNDGLDSDESVAQHKRRNKGVSAAVESDVEERLYDSLDAKYTGKTQEDDTEVSRKYHEGRKLVKCVDVATDKKQETCVVATKSMYKLKAVRDSKMRFMSLFAESTFAGSGIAMLEPGVSKPEKKTGDRAMFGFVSEGAMDLTINDESVIVEAGDSFLIPRGNRYSLSNIGGSENAVFFFVQASEGNLAEMDRKMKEVKRKRGKNEHASKRRIKHIKRSHKSVPKSSSEGDHDEDVSIGEVDNESDAAASFSESDE